MDQNTTIGEHLNLQELGVVIDKISFQNVLPQSDRLSVTRDCLHQFQKPTIDKEEDTDKAKADKITEDTTLISIRSVSQTEIAATSVAVWPARYRKEKNFKGLSWIPINRKMVETILLVFLICVISTTIILPFFLLIGRSIRSWSPSSVSYDYDESCNDTVSVSLS